MREDMAEVRDVNTRIQDPLFLIMATMNRIPT